jgi:hypothetical protein
MENQENNQVSQNLKNKLNKTLKKPTPQIPEQFQEETPQEESHEQAQMNPEQVQDFKESLHNEATFRLELLLQKENQHNELKNILVEFGSALFEKLDRIALAFEKLGEPSNEVQ